MQLVEVLAKKMLPLCVWKPWTVSQKMDSYLRWPMGKVKFQIGRNVWLHWWRKLVSNLSDHSQGMCIPILILYVRDGLNWVYVTFEKGELCAFSYLPVNKIDGFRLEPHILINIMSIRRQEIRTLPSGKCSKVWNNFYALALHHRPWKRALVQRLELLLCD